MVEALLQALVQIFSPLTFTMLMAGVLIGLALGAFPGLSGLPGYAILIPFVYGMEPTEALGLLVGMGAALHQCDSVPAVLFGVPGTAGAQADILDGYPMARRGEAGRALGAAFTAAAVGGVIGGICLVVAVPILKPVILAFGAPEFTMLAILGIAALGTLSGGAPMKGIIAGALGFLLSLIGMDKQSGILRFTFGSLYLWSGIGMIPFTLGLFAVPELVSLVIQRSRIASTTALEGVGKDRMEGVKDFFRNWFLGLRCSILGVFVGIIPGLGSAIVDWLAYIFARETCKGARESFGKGDVRGIIAPESAANAKSGGGWIPTVAFGVPGSAGMAVMLGVMIWVLGLAPGPDMLTTNLDVTFTIAWALILGNIIASLIAFAFVKQFALITKVPSIPLVAVLMPIIFIGAYAGNAPQLGSLAVLMVIGLLGFFMKLLRWPRPPFLLAFVLGALIEKNLFISVQAYGAGWVLRPITLVLGIIVLAFVCYSIMLFKRKTKRTYTRKPRLILENCVLLIPAAIAAFAVIEARKWPPAAGFFPWVTGWTTILLSIAEFIHVSFQVKSGAKDEILDLPLDLDVSGRELTKRVFLTFSWLFGILGSIHLLGFRITLPLFTFAYLKFQGKASWVLTGWLTLLTGIICIVLFEQILQIIWPRPLIKLLLPPGFWPF